MIRYKLRTLLILTALGPPVLAAVLMMAGVVPVNSTVVAVAAYIGLLATLIAVSKFAESRNLVPPPDNVK